MAEQKRKEEQRLAEQKRKEEDKLAEQKKKKEEEKKIAEEMRKREELNKANDEREGKFVLEEDEDVNFEKATYPKKDITNDEDYNISDLLDLGDDFIQEKNLERANDHFEQLLTKYPNSPRALYGKALSLDKLAEKQRSNKMLEEAIATFQKVMDAKDTPDELFKQAGLKLGEKLEFRGWNSKAAATYQNLVNKFPSDITVRKKLGVSYLLMGQNEKARRVFSDILDIDKGNNFARVHLGFIVKVTDNNPQESIPLLRAIMESNSKEIQEGKFYFHLGDAYQRLNQTEKAYEVYERGVKKGLFLSKYQRSLYNCDGIKAQPWWKPEETGYQQYLKILTDNWKLIRDEGMKQIDPKTGSFLPEEENLLDKGQWMQFTLYARGKKNAKNCAKVPKVCELLDQITPAKSCVRGQIKYSLMKPGVHVWPHCGPTNCRIRAHLGLVIPEGPKIRVADETRTWKEGQFIIIDDSFEHEVWHTGASDRLILIVDFWHPDIDEKTRRTLDPI